MSKTTLPAPPQPSFSGASSPQKTPVSSSFSAPSPRSSSPFRTVPLDLDFLVRVARTSLWFGGLLMILAGLVTRSAWFAASLAVGVALGVVLLYSQTWFVRNLAKFKANPRASRFPAWTLLPFKYLALLVFVGVVIHFNLVNAIAFVVGVTVVQFVIVAKVLGRMMTQNRPSIYEAYVEKGRHDR